MRSVLLYRISIFVSRSISFDHCRYLKRNRTYIDFYVLPRIFLCYQNRLPFRKQDIRKLIFEIYSMRFRTKDIFGEVLLIAPLPNIIHASSAWLLTENWSAPKHTHYFLRRSPSTPAHKARSTKPTKVDQILKNDFKSFKVGRLWTLVGVVKLTSSRCCLKRTNWTGFKLCYHHSAIDIFWFLSICALSSMKAHRWRLKNLRWQCS